MDVAVNYIDRIAQQIREHVPRQYLPSNDADALFRIYAVLLLAKGDLVSAADVHNAWSAWMAGCEADHESLVPLEQLPSEAVEQDVPFVKAIRAVARAQSDGEEK